MYHYEEEAHQVIKMLKEGKIILFPTDTIWGIGCLVSFPEAVERIYKIKKRDPSKSMILLADSIVMLKKYIQSIHPRVETLMGYHTRPLTVVYPKAKNLEASIPASDGSIAIRVCEDRFCQLLLQGTGVPLISTSANLAGQAYPENFSQIPEEIKNAVDYVVKYRQNESGPQAPSVIVRYEPDGELEFLRN